jgi:hypothetical protein
MAEQRGDISTCLQRLADGDPDVENQLYLLVLPELKRRAHRLMQSERRGHTLRPTELVNTVYIRIAAATKIGIKSGRTPRISTLSLLERCDGISLITQKSIIGGSK